jgi:hypothetical protein
MATPLYLFEGSNIGPFGVTYDTINIPEMMYLLTKKNFGIANTLPDIPYTAEFDANYLNNIPNAFSYIYQTKLYSQSVPLSNPMATRTQFDPSKGVLDVSWSNYNFGKFYNTTMSNDNLSKRYVSKTHPHICFYSNLMLTHIPARTNFQTVYSNYLPTYVHPLLVQSISKRYDFSYFTRLRQNNGIDVIASDDGYSLIDNEAGTVVFYDSNTQTPQVGPNNLPRISFYRYEGLFGEASILQGQDL